MDFIRFISSFLFLLVLSVPAHAWTLKGLCQRWLVKPSAEVEQMVAPKSVARAEFSWIDARYRDGYWVISEALKTYHKLQTLPPEQRGRQSIDYLRGQLPLLITTLRTLNVPKDTPYWLVDANGKPLDGAVKTLDRAVELLIQEGKQHYLQRDVTLEWFPQYVLEVVGLRWFMRMSHKNKWTMPTPERFQDWLRQLEENRHATPGGFLALKRDTPEWYAFHMMKEKKYLEEQRKLGALHWPTIADLRVSHFRNWHLHIKPLGYTESGFAQLDGSAADDFELYGHDIDAHDLPDDFIVHKEQFAQIVEGFEQGVKEEKWDHQVLMNLMWFETTHESGKLYEMFVHLMEHPSRKIEEDIHEGLREILYINGEPDHFVSVVMSRLNGELTSGLRELPHAALKKEVAYAYRRFTKVLIQAFQQASPSTSIAEVRRLRE